MIDLTLTAFWSAQKAVLQQGKLLSEGNVTAALKIDAIVGRARADARAALEALQRRRQPRVTIHAATVGNLNTGHQAFEIRSPPT